VTIGVAPSNEHAIVVLGAAVDQQGRPCPPLARRLRRALADAAADPRAVVIVSGGGVRGRPAEAPAMRDWLVARGLDAARIVIEAEARSTYENVLHCADLIAGQGFRRVTLVTERYHMLRARLLFARAFAARGLRIELRTSAAPDQLGAFERVIRCLREFTKIAGGIWRLRRS